MLITEMPTMQEPMPFWPSTGDEAATASVWWPPVLLIAAWWLSWQMGTLSRQRRIDLCSISLLNEYTSSCPDCLIPPTPPYLTAWLNMCDSIKPQHSETSLFSFNFSSFLPPPFLFFLSFLPLFPLLRLPLLFLLLLPFPLFLPLCSFSSNS